MPSEICYYENKNNESWQIFIFISNFFNGNKMTDRPSFVRFSSVNISLYFKLFLDSSLNQSTNNYNTDKQYQKEGL